VLRMSMIASGIATILQSLPNGPVGSGYFFPISSGPTYISVSILAGKVGGLRAVFTMTLLSGLFEGLLARIVPRLRSLFPPEVTGLVVTMVGVVLVGLGCPRFLGFHAGGAGTQASATTVGIVTLAAMIAPTVWGKGKLKLYPVLIGLVVGYLFAYFLGVFQTERLREMLAAPMVSLPRKVHMGWFFDLTLLPAFLIVSLASTLKAVGDLTLCQKINDADWKRTDMQSVSGGISAVAIGTGLSGLLGGIGQSTFSSNVGLSLAHRGDQSLHCDTLRHPDDPPSFFAEARGLFCRDAGPRDGSDFDLCGLLYDSCRHSGDHVAHARRASNFRCRHRSDLRPERRHGPRTVPRRAQPDPASFFVVSSCLYGFRRGSEPAFSDWYYPTPASGVDAGCRWSSENF
jgi:Permease family